MILKSDGASLYNTTDLATIVERMKLYDPDEIVYVVDKRQELYFTQVFFHGGETGRGGQGDVCQQIVRISHIVVETQGQPLNQSIQPTL